MKYMKQREQIQGFRRMRARSARFPFAMCFSVLLAGFACFIYAAGTANAAALNERGLFEHFIRNITRNYPQSFSCRITGDAITSSLERIPPDARTGRPEVFTYFERGRGQVIRVRNVDELFRNMFSSYQPYLGMTGAWIEARGSDWASFSREHEMRITGEDAQGWTARISRRGEDGGSYAVFRFARADYSVRAVQFFNADQLVYSVSNEYRRVGNFTLPSAMNITSYRDGRAQSVSRLIFSDYRVNIRLPDGVFQR
jgi:hypothetical protein